MIPCTITVGTHTYAGLFPSTCAAVQDAMGRSHGATRITARPQP